MSYLLRLMIVFSSGATWISTDLVDAKLVEADFVKAKIKRKKNI